MIMDARLVLLLAAGLLSACGTTGVPPRAALDPLPASICAPVEAEPQGPAITPDQQTTGDAAVIVALGEALGVPLIRHREVEHPAWGRRQAERVKAGVDYCASRSVTAAR